MIQANDLKIGNRFIREIPSTRGQEFDHDFVLTEEWMGKLFGENTSFALNDLHPIPLTPEILEKAGFRNISDLSTNMYTSFWNDIVGQISGYHNGYFFKDSVCNDINVLQINYVHQLQNLYFALTGEELEVNLSVVVARGTI